MKIECKTTFLDGRDRFEAGDVRTVDDSKAAYFINNGWAAKVGEEGAVPASGPVTLAVDNAVMGTGDSNG